MSDSAWMYEQMSYPLLKMELRRLRGELEKLTARAEAATRELDKRLSEPEALEDDVLEGSAPSEPRATRVRDTLASGAVNDSGDHAPAVPRGNAAGGGTS